MSISEPVYKTIDLTNARLHSINLVDEPLDPSWKINVISRWSCLLCATGDCDGVHHYYIKS